LTRRMLYLPALIVAAVLMACAVVVLALSEKAEATFPGKNGRIAYAGWNRGKDFEIYTINPDGSGKTQLTHNNTDDLDPAYSPDGKRIAYTDLTLNEHGPHIYSIKVGGGGKSLVARNGGAPSYSPDGKRIAYMGPDGKIYTINARGGGKSRVTNDDAYPYGLSWGIRP
jgi:Tol biopolymer transport system component